MSDIAHWILLSYGQQLRRLRNADSAVDSRQRRAVLEQLESEAIMYAELNAVDREVSKDDVL